MTRIWAKAIRQGMDAEDSMEDWALDEVKCQK